MSTHKTENNDLDLSDLDERSKRYLRKIADSTGKTPAQVLQRIIIEYRGQKVADEVDEMNAARKAARVQDNACFEPDTEISSLGIALSRPE